MGPQLLSFRGGRELSYTAYRTACQAAEQRALLPYVSSQPAQTNTHEITFFPPLVSPVL